MPRTYIYDVLKGTLRDILCERRYDRLETEVDDTVRTLEGEHNLEVNNEIWTGQIKQLQELIESDRVKNEQDAKNFLAKARRINVEVDNCRIVNSYNLGKIAISSRKTNKTIQNIVKLKIFIILMTSIR